MSYLKLTNQTAILGENIAVKWLLSHNFTILDRNWRQNTGEIDIIAKKNNSIHFIEVKSKNNTKLEEINLKSNTLFQNIHSQKLSRLQRTIEIYLSKNDISHETKWQIDALGVYIDKISKKAKVILLENIIS